MNIFAILDLVHVVAQFLPDIRVLRLNRGLEVAIREHPEYTLWQKCTATNSIYSYATVKMLGDRVLDLGKINHAIEHDNMPMVEHLVAAGASIKLLLTTAAKYGRLSLVEKYYCDQYEWRMMTTAVSHDQLDIVGWLCKKNPVALSEYYLLLELCGAVLPLNFNA